eukprot:TRINITY_DN67664_c11_g5_i1.p1 TRINITY_DN67664_c11_g5~~TRINITY_DN67664_c11_g5_i1.p1  ORF type:complete len:361 (-),score=19.90 TRINITY_DN67664_c11_g5_i1:157-1239(-)
MSNFTLIVAPVQHTTDRGYLLDAIGFAADFSGMGKVWKFTTLGDAGELRFNEVKLTADLMERKGKAENGYFEFVKKWLHSDWKDCAGLPEFLDKNLANLLSNGDTLSIIYINHGKPHGTEVAPGVVISRDHWSDVLAKCIAKGVKVGFVGICCYAICLLREDTLRQLQFYYLDDPSAKGKSYTYAYDHMQDLRCGTASAMRFFYGFRSQLQPWEMFTNHLDYPVLVQQNASHYGTLDLSKSAPTHPERKPERLRATAEGNFIDASLGNYPVLKKLISVIDDLPQHWKLHQFVDEWMRDSCKLDRVQWMNSQGKKLSEMTCFLLSVGLITYSWSGSAYPMALVYYNVEQSTLQQTLAKKQP